MILEKIDGRRLLKKNKVEFVTLLLKKQRFWESCVDQQKFFLQLFFYDKAENLLSSPSYKKEISLYLKEPFLPFLFKSDSFSLPKECCSFQIDVFVEQEVYSRVRVQAWFLSQEKELPRFVESVRSLTSWRDLLELELMRESLEFEKIFCLFRVFILLNLRQEAYRSAKSIVTCVQEIPSEIVLSAKKFLEDYHCLCQTEPLPKERKKPKSDFLFSPSKREVHEERAIFYIQRSQGPWEVDFPRVKPGERHVILRTLGVLEGEKTHHIIKKELKDSIVFYTKPFASFSDLKYVSFEKQLALDFYISAQILKKWKFVALFFDSKKDDFYIKALALKLSKRFDLEVLI